MKRRAFANAVSCKQMDKTEDFPLDEKNVAFQEQEGLIHGFIRISDSGLCPR